MWKWPNIVIVAAAAAAIIGLIIVGLNRFADKFTTEKD